MSQYLPKPYERSGWNTKFDLDLSSYATKSNLKEAIGVDRYW